MTNPVTLKGLEDLVKKYGDAEYDLGVGGAQVRSIRKQEAWEALLSALRAFVEERGEHIALRQTEEAWRRRAEERAEKAERERDAALIAGSDAENRWRVRNDCTIAEALRGATERAAQVVLELGIDGTRHSIAAAIRALLVQRAELEKDEPRIEALCDHGIALVGPCQACSDRHRKAASARGVEPEKETP